eukprot:m.179258 g.179258  ORF g.179258 m.179258 type:complete len:788 (+) comp13567_c1_seq7:131-2494(+)
MTRKRKTRKFVDKNAKGTYTFMLVPRSQRDPRTADSESSPYVLQPMQPPNSKQNPDELLPDVLEQHNDVKGHGSMDDAMMAMMMGEHDDEHNEGEEKQKHNVNLEEFGIYYKDDYDYMQHLAPRGNEADIMLADEKAIQEELERRGTVKPKNAPLSADLFASLGEEKVALLDRALDQNTLHLDWDPEVIAALDDETAVDAEVVDGDEYDNFFDQVINSGEGDVGSDGAEMDDFDRDVDFVEDEEGQFRDYSDDEGEHAHQQTMYGEADTYEDVWRKIGHGKSNTDVMDLHKRLGTKNEEGMTEVRSKFTDYSMTSSVLPRSENLQNVDDHFEIFYDNYDEENIGALDLCAEDEDVVGEMESDALEGMLSELTDDLGSKMTLLDVVRERHAFHTATKEGNDGGDDGDSNATIDADEQKERDAIVTGEEHSGSDDGEDSGDEVEHELVDVAMEPAKEREWDCESILSTRSTLYNHPTVVSERKKKGKKQKSRKGKKEKEGENDSGDEEEEEEEEKKKLSADNDDGEVADEEAGQGEGIDPILDGEEINDAFEGETNDFDIKSNEESDDIGEAHAHLPLAMEMTSAVQEVTIRANSHTQKGKRLKNNRKSRRFSASTFLESSFMSVTSIGFDIHNIRVSIDGRIAVLSSVAIPSGRSKRTSRIDVYSCNGDHLASNDCIDGASSLLWMPNGRHLAVCAKRVVYFLHPLTLEEKAKHVFGKTIYTLVMSSDGRFLFAGCKDGRVLLACVSGCFMHSNSHINTLCAFHGPVCFQFFLQPHFRIEYSTNFYSG